MKETDFIKQNQEKWREIETQFQSKRKEHEKLSEQFVQLSEDLSYAQTYYPRRTVRVYLNSLSQKLYKRVFNARTKDKSKRFRFWTHELPTALWEARIELSLAMGAFLLAVFIGVISSEYENSFAQQILGDYYVNMTEENIAKGDPMAVYKDDDAVGMFFKIMYNNLRVSAFTFILGILFGIGTLGIIFRNGVMLGVFQYFFFQRDLGFESMLTIWQHGTIEIASIVVAGGAGLVLGRSMIYPGTLPRSVSMKFGFLKGLKILLGVAPLIVLAAFFESFYTRFDDLPMVFRLATILGSLAFTIGYYVILPIKRGRKLSLLKDVEENYGASYAAYEFKPKKLKKNGEILSDVIYIIQEKMAAFLKAAAIPAAILALVSITLLREDFSSYLFFNGFSGNIIQDIFITIGGVFSRLEMFGQYFYSSQMWVVILMAVIGTWLTIMAEKIIQPFVIENGESTKKLKVANIVLLYIFHLIFLVPLVFSGWFALFYFLIPLPAISVGWHQSALSGEVIFKSILNASTQLFRLPMKHLGMMLITALFSFLVAFMVQSPVLYITFEMGNSFVGFNDTNAKFFLEFAIVFVAVLSLFCSIVFLHFNVVLNALSMKEIQDPSWLREEISNIKIGKRGLSNQK